MTPVAFFTLLAVVAVSFEAPVVATVFGVLAFCLIGHGA
jgi:hypothetical protein